jgi:peptidoglycan/LPS O-acetylase OafA/YrhL
MTTTHLPSPPEPDAIRATYLDGLRGWAALFVVIYHATWELFGDAVPQFQTQVPSIINNGSAAVCVFFVLSGYVLSIGFLRTDDVDVLRKLAARRYPRLTIPIAVASLMTYALMKFGLMFNQQAAVIVDHNDWLGGFYTQTPSLTDVVSFFLYRLYSPYTDIRSYGVFLWTMPIEMLGSFTVFALLALTNRNSLSRYVYYLVGGLFCWNYQPSIALFIYGVMIADISSRPSLALLWTGHRGNLIGAVAVGFALWGDSIIAPPTFDPRHGGVFAAAMVLGVVASPICRRFLSRGVSRFLGRISFPLYLVHSAVLSSASSYLILMMNRAGYSLPGIAAVVAPATVLISLIVAAAFQPVERFSIWASHRISDILLRKMPGVQKTAAGFARDELQIVDRRPR